jgi:hypothetical protein
MNESKSNGPIIGLAIGGLVVGGVLGFLFRPSAFLVGQLSFNHVISRGTSLTGMDQILIPLAQKSFNIMFAVAIVGAIAGALIGLYISKKN